MAFVSWTYWTEDTGQTKTMVNNSSQIKNNMNKATIYKVVLLNVEHISKPLKNINILLIKS